MALFPKTHHELRHERPLEVVAAVLADFHDSHPDETVVAAVCGPGGSGKSTLCAALAGMLPDCGVVKLDDYNRPRAQRAESGLLGSHPEAVKLDLLVDHLAELKCGREVEKPVYDPVSGRDDGCERVGRWGIVLLDGEAAAFERLRPHMDFLVFVAASPETALSVRMVRDVEERGADLDKVMRVHRQSDLVDFPRFGAGSRVFADLVLEFDSGFRHRLSHVADEHRGHPVFG